MAKGKYITPAQRYQVNLLRKQRLSLSAIASQLQLSKTAVYQAMQHVNKFNSCMNNPRKSYKRKTSAQMDRIIHRISEANRRKTAVDIHSELQNHAGFAVSVSTVKRRLGEFGLHGRVARKKPFISEKNRKARLKFAEEHVGWTQNEWNRVLFSDETKFNRMGSDGKAYVRRRPGEEFLPMCTKATVKGGGGSLMFWGAMSRRGPGPIHRIDGIMDSHGYISIMNDVMLPYGRSQIGRNWCYQHDNDPKHTSRVSKEWFVQKRVRLLQWPPQSPDLNPIETLWNDVQSAIKMRKPRNLSELETVVKGAWSEITVQRCCNLIDSMPRRLAEVFKNNGYSTSY
jgi:transposase